MSSWRIGSRLCTTKRTSVPGRTDEILDDEATVHDVDLDGDGAGAECPTRR